MHPLTRGAFLTTLTASLVTLSTQSFAAAFQLWEQDGGTLATYHAGYAALANDASTAWYNPAGIPRIKNQQAVFGAVAIMPNFKYRGSVTVTTQSFISPTQTYNNVTAQGGTFNLVPNLNYVAPITDKLGFGFSVTVPFGLKTDYGRYTPLRYAATLTSITDIDISPSLGLQLTDQFSIGAGFDAQHVEADFDSVAVALIFPDPSLTDSESKNKADGWGYGYHLGALYQFSPCTRVGISYHSKVHHHLHGSSKFNGPIAYAINDGYALYTHHSRANVTLPAYTALSVYHRPHPKWAVMGTVIYTQWNVFKTLVLSNVAGAIPDPVEPIAPSTTIQVVVPEHYHNSINLSVGGDYYVNDALTLRGGVGYDQSPVRNAYRNVQLPDKDRYVVAFGGHYQANKCVGIDLAYAHLFVPKADVHPPDQIMGAQIVSTNGHANGGADVLSGQIIWDIF